MVRTGQYVSGSLVPEVFLIIHASIVGLHFAAVL